MPVALQDLRRHRGGLQPEPLARQPLELGIGRRVGADDARELAHAHALEGMLQALASAPELEGPARQLEPEGRRLGMYTMGAADGDDLPVLVRPRNDGAKGTVDACEHERAGLSDLERERRVEHVRRREPVVEPAALGPEPLGNGVDERGDVVLRPGLELRDPLRRGRNRAGAYLGGVFRRNASELRPRVDRGELDVEPARELVLLRPDPGHFGPRIALDHERQSRVGPGRTAGSGYATAASISPRPEPVS